MHAPCPTPIRGTVALGPRLLPGVLPGVLLGVLLAGLLTGCASDAADDGVLPEPLLDLREQLTSASIEQGLLGLAFHPQWPADASTRSRTASFGLDANGEVLIVDWAEGAVHRLIARR